MADFLGPSCLPPSSDDNIRPESGLRPPSSATTRKSSKDSLSANENLRNCTEPSVSPSSVVKCYSPTSDYSSYSSRTSSTSSSSSLVWISLVLALICSISQVAAIPSHQVRQRHSFLFYICLLFFWRKCYLLLFTFSYLIIYFLKNSVDFFYYFLKLICLYILFCLPLYFLDSHSNGWEGTSANFSSR